MTTTRIALSTTAYQFAHGRAPRGRGSWAFEFCTAAGWGEPVFFPVSTYAEARRAAVLHAAAVGALSVRVST